MANHSFVRYNRRRLNLKSHEVEVMLKSFVVARFGGHVVVERVAGGPMERQGYTVWHCMAPGTELPPELAGKSLMAPNNPAGFPVWYKLGLLEFRHPINTWERWAQRCIEEDFAIHLGATMEDEGAGGEHKAKRDASNFNTVREYLGRNFDKPLSDEDNAWIESLMHVVPEMFR